MDDPFQNPFLILLLALSVWLATAILSHWRDVRVAKIKAASNREAAAVKAELTRDMLDRGLSAAEIEQVLRGRERQGEPAPQLPPGSLTGQEDLDKAILVKLMAEYDFPTEDIERVVRALPPPAEIPSGNRAASVRARAIVVKEMVQCLRTAREIEQILRAFHGDQEEDLARSIQSASPH